MRLIPDVELSVHQLGGEGSVQLDLSGVPVLAPLSVQTLQTSHQMMEQVQMPTNGYLV